MLIINKERKQNRKIKITKQRVAKVMVELIYFTAANNVVLTNYQNVINININSQVKKINTNNVSSLLQKILLKIKNKLGTKYSKHRKFTEK